MVKQIRASSVASGDEPRHMGDAMLQAAKGKDVTEHEVRQHSADSFLHLLGLWCQRGIPSFWLGGG